MMALGELEQVVLLTLVRLGGEAHGPAIITEMHDRLDRSVAPGALYTVMERFEQKGFVASWIGDSVPERGGRRRKVYRLLPEGASELRSWYAGIRAMASQETIARLDAIVGGAS